MSLIRRKEIERMGISLSAAVLVHLVLFFAAEYFGVFVSEPAPDRSGPLHVGLQDAAVALDPTGPGSRTAQKLHSLSSEQPKIEETISEARPDPRPESVPASSQPVRSDSDVTDESTFSGKDRSNSFTVKMGSRSDRARPAFRLPVELPEWLRGKELKLELSLSFVAGKDGKIVDLYVHKSSGFADVDRAVAKSILKWKFSNPIMIDRILGTFAYRINQ